MVMHHLKHLKLAATRSSLSIDFTGRMPRQVILKENDRNKTNEFAAFDCAGMYSTALAYMLSNILVHPSDP